ncbi:hypothetical protein [Pararhizobium sp. O133]|uniref:hypothetical protein n=1 Tax=Pararhizobium sp. O133 TaxID=3449278 RepID=UPI003F684515
MTRIVIALYNGDLAATWNSLPEAGRHAARRVAGDSLVGNCDIVAGSRSDVSIIVGKAFLFSDHKTSSIAIAQRDNLDCLCIRAG